MVRESSARGSFHSSIELTSLNIRLLIQSVISKFLRKEQANLVVILERGGARNFAISIARKTVHIPIEIKCRFIDFTVAS